LFAPSSVTVVVRRDPAPVMKYVWFTKRSPVPFPCRKAELRSGTYEAFRPRIGVSSTVPLSIGNPSCGLWRIVFSVPYT
jgi:hypothetical protein